jgi:hypothetical protein
MKGRVEGGKVDRKDERNRGRRKGRDEVGREKRGKGVRKDEKKRGRRKGREEGGKGEGDGSWCVCVGEPQNINYCFSANGGGSERERLITGIY